MGRSPKGKLMEQAEIIDMAKQKKASSKLYKAEVKEINDESISKSVQKAMSVMKTSEITGKTNLDDTDNVKRLINIYLETCIQESAIPSMTDIAMILGYTRRNIYYYMRNSASTPTGKFLWQVHDIIANTLADNALKGNVNNIVSIFLLKSFYGIREDDDTVTKLINGDDDDSGGMTVEQIRQKYSNLIE